MKMSGIAALVLVLFAQIFATSAAAQVYNVRPGDTLRIEVIEDPSLNRTALVSPDGRITVALAGSIQAGGRSVEEIQAELALKLAPNFAATPSVFVSLESLRPVVPAAPRQPAPPPTMDIFVLGEVGTPGKMQVDPNTTVLQLFAQMGGFTRFAATSRIQLRRTAANGTETVYTIDYDAIEAGLSPNGTVTLSEGYVIVVPQRRLFE
jgi:polysaccharide export outer membrane protein